MSKTTGRSVTYLQMTAFLNAERRRVPEGFLADIFRTEHLKLRPRLARVQHRCFLREHQATRQTFRFEETTETRCLTPYETPHAAAWDGGDRLYLSVVDALRKTRRLVRCSVSSLLEPAPLRLEDLPSSFYWRDLAWDPESSRLVGLLWDAHGEGFFLQQASPEGEVIQERRLEGAVQPVALALHRERIYVLDQGRCMVTTHDRETLAPLDSSVKHEAFASALTMRLALFPDRAALLMSMWRLHRLGWVSCDFLGDSPGGACKVSLETRNGLVFPGRASVCRGGAMGVTLQALQTLDVAYVICYDADNVLQDWLQLPAVQHPGAWEVMDYPDKTLVLHGVPGGFKFFTIGVQK